MRLDYGKNEVSGRFSKDELYGWFQTDFDSFSEDENSVKKLAFALMVIANNKGYKQIKAGDEINIRLYQTKEREPIYSLVIKKRCPGKESTDAEEKNVSVGKK